MHSNTIPSIDEVLGERNLCTPQQTKRGERAHQAIVAVDDFLALLEATARPAGHDNGVGAANEAEIGTQQHAVVRGRGAYGGSRLGNRGDLRDSDDDDDDDDGDGDGDDDELEEQEAQGEHEQEADEDEAEVEGGASAGESLDEGAEDIGLPPRAKKGRYAPVASARAASAGHGMRGGHGSALRLKVVRARTSRHGQLLRQ